MNRDEIFELLNCKEWKENFHQVADIIVGNYPTEPNTNFFHSLDTIVICPSDSSENIKKSIVMAKRYCEVSMNYEKETLEYESEMKSLFDEGKTLEQIAKEFALDFLGKSLNEGTKKVLWDLIYQSKIDFGIKAVLSEFENQTKILNILNSDKEIYLEFFKESV